MMFPTVCTGRSVSVITSSLSSRIRPSTDVSYRFDVVLFLNFLVCVFTVKVFFRIWRCRLSSLFDETDLRK